MEEAPGLMVWFCYFCVFLALKDHLTLLLGLFSLICEMGSTGL